MPTAHTRANAGKHEGNGNKNGRHPLIPQNLIKQFTDAGKVVYCVGPEREITTILQTAPSPSILINTPAGSSLGTNIRAGLERVMNDYASLPGIPALESVGAWQGKNLRDLVVGISFSDYVTTSALIKQEDARFAEAGKDVVVGLLYVKNDTYEPGWEDKGVFTLSSEKVSAGHYHWVRPAHLRRAFVDNLSSTVYRFRSNISKTGVSQKLCFAFKPRNWPEVAELSRRVRQTYHSEDHPFLERDLRSSAIPRILQYLLFKRIPIPAFEKAIVTAALSRDSREAGWDQARIILTDEKTWMRDGDYQRQREELEGQARRLLDA